MHFCISLLTDHHDSSNLLLMILSIKVTFAVCVHDLSSLQLNKQMNKQNVLIVLYCQWMKSIVFQIRVLLFLLFSLSLTSKFLSLSVYNCYSLNTLYTSFFPCNCSSASTCRIFFMCSQYTHTHTYACMHTHTHTHTHTQSYRLAN